MPHTPRARRPGTRLLLVALTGLAAGACAHTAAASGPTAPRSSAPSVEVGAYYSEWYPTNASQGTLRQHLVPAQGANPALDHSADPGVAEQAISQASRHGIDFFALQWSPAQPAWNRNVDAFMRARNLGDIKFCIFYGTPDLNWDAAHLSTPVTPAVTAHFASDMLHLAARYATSPSYLRVDGRPVFDLYLTRTLTGDVAGMIDHARMVLEQHGYGDPFFIGDEIFWGVTGQASTPAATVVTTTPQVGRIRLFDAITDYNLYGGGPPDPQIPGQDFTGYPGQTALAADEVALYRRYAAAAGPVPVLPDVMPGTNTRGVRLAVDQPAEPRQWLPGLGPGSTLTGYLTQVALPVLDPRLPVVFVTSWNEWNEDSGIQPTAGTPTTRDDSATGTAYTQGYTYGGEGDAALVAVRDATTAVYGQVGPGGRGSVVELERHGTVVSTTTATSDGWFALPRTAATNGTLDLVCGRRHRVTVDPTRAVRSDCR